MKFLLTVALMAEELWAGPTVTICLKTGNTTWIYRQEAETTASRILTQAGVHTKWLNREEPCRSGNGILVRALENTPADLKPGTLAYALPYKGDEVVIFLDRVVNAPSDGSLIASLLGHVMAHEIVHLLQGVSRHSETGLMKPHWSPSDYSVMKLHPLRMAEEDIDLIQAGLNKRATAGPLFSRR